MDIDIIDIFPTGGMCITLPKSIAALNRAVTWVKEEVLKQRYYAYYDLNNRQRYEIGTYTTLEKAVQARNNYEIGLIETRGVKGVLLALAKFMGHRLNCVTSQ